MEKPKHQSGDLLLDRYLPEADEETRERARDVFRAYARLLLRIEARLAREQSTGGGSRPDGSAP